MQYGLVTLTLLAGAIAFLTKATESRLTGNYEYNSGPDLITKILTLLIVWAWTTVLYAVSGYAFVSVGLLAMVFAGTLLCKTEDPYLKRLVACVVAFAFTLILIHLFV